MVEKFFSQTRKYFFTEVLSWAMAAQIAVVGLALLLASRAIRSMQTWCDRQREKCAARQEKCDDLDTIISFLKIISPFLASLIVIIAWRVAGHLNWPHDGLHIASIILLTISMVRFITGQMHNRVWASILTAVIWFWAMLYMFRTIDPLLDFLQHIDFNLGQVHLSLLIILRASVLSLMLYWFCRKLLFVWHFWLTAVSDLTPAVQILFSKLGGIFLFFASILLILHYLGLDITVFALFGGALGLGLGFSLQKVVANVISGFIILADKSIKPGDVIQLDDTFGWINSLGSRYTSVISRDGTEHLIPNEKFISDRVINWSHSHNFIRLHLPLGVSYESDLEKARDLMLAVAGRTPRILQDPRPACRLMGFGDSAINLELRVWIRDPQNGVANVRSELYWGIWKEFREHNIQIPFPQRDVNLKTVPDSKIRTGPEEG